MLGFGPFCLDLGHIAWIWAIWQNMGQNRPQRRQSPEDGAGGTDIRTVFYRTSSPSGPLPKKWLIEPRGTRLTSLNGWTVVS